MITILAASTAGRVPITEPFIFTVDVDGVRAASLLANISLIIEHAFRVSLASRNIVDVFDITTSCAGLRNFVVVAHGRLVLAFGGGHESAVCLALTSDGVELAVSIGVATVDVIATRFTGLNATRVSELARRFDFTFTLSGTRALGVADGGGRVPLAIGFERTEIVVGRTIGALSLAGSVGVVPFTRSSESTFSLGAEEVALGSTLFTEGVPEAVAVGVATSRFDVGIAAAGSTDAGGVQPHTARD